MKRPDNSSVRLLGVAVVLLMALGSFGQVDHRDPPAPLAVLVAPLAPPTFAPTPTPAPTQAPTPEPTREPTPAPTPEPQPAPIYAPGSVEALICSYPWPCDVALRIVRRESNFDCAALNVYDWPPGSGNHATGLFQLVGHTALYHGGDPFDCAVNTEAAWELYAADGSDFRDWGGSP